MTWQDRPYSSAGDYDSSGFYYRPQMRVRFGPVMTPTVKYLLIANIAVFVLDLLVRLFITERGLLFLAFDPYYAFRNLWVWQLVTHMFMHGGVFHLLFNMFALWMFGCEVERRIGDRHFLWVYFLCGIGGAGLFTLAHLGALESGGVTVLVGASGAISGILVSFGMLFPERVITLLLFFVLPVRLKAKHLVAGFFIFEVLNELNQASGDNVAHLTHLGGMVFAYFYMKFKFGLSLPFAFTQRVGWRAKAWFSGMHVRTPRPNYGPMDSKSFISEEIDPILEKISRHGIKSLTWRERRALKKARSRMK